MRWLVTQPGPSWSVHDVYVGWVEALRAAGQQVHGFNLDDRLALYTNAFVELETLKGPGGESAFRRALDSDQAAELAVNGLAAALFKVRPDVLLVISGFFIPHELLDQARSYGTRVVVMHTEEPYEVDRELAMAAHADLNLLNDPMHIEAFRAVAPSLYAPHAYRPAVHHPGPGDPRLACDLAFVGTGFGSRRWFFEQLAPRVEGLDVLLAGNWQDLPEDSPLRPWIAADDPGHCLDNARTAEVYRSARCGINLYRREAEDDTVTSGWAMGPREVEMAACGLFFLRDPRPESDRVLSMLPAFESPAEAADLLRWHLARPDTGTRLAAAAREAVADRTFDHHARQLLRLLDSQPVPA